MRHDPAGASIVIMLRSLKLLSYDFSRLPRQKGATARHAIYGGQWRGSDREKLGRLWRRAVVGSPPSSSSVLNGYPGSRPG